MVKFKTFVQKLWEPVNATSIDVFRKCFAVLLIIQIAGFYSADLINKTFILPRMRIPFDYSAWIPLLPGKSIHLAFVMQFIGAALLFLDKHTRKGALIYLLSFGYIFLLDISYYNNHYYFILLLCAFFCFYKPVKIQASLQVPNLLLYLFQFQVIVVYFYGGVAKLNEDWLVHQEPMREMLQLTNRHHWPESIIYFYTYAGLVFDLCIGFLLLIPRTRKVAIFLTILFHLSNIFMFSSGANATIGIFPFLMIATNLLFIDPNQLQKFLTHKIPFYFKPEDAKKKKLKWADIYLLSEGRKKMILVLVIFYVLGQLLIPLRHLLIPGNVDWTGEGWYFSWRLKVRSKTSVNYITVKDSRSGKTDKVNPLGFLNTLQYKAICDDPAAMYFFIHRLKEEAAKTGMQTQFYLNWTCKMNAHPSQALVDSTKDFSAFPHHPLGGDTWILAFK